MALLFKKGTLGYIALLLLVIIPAFVGAQGGAKKGERKIKYWRAPMDPSYISDKPGKSPMGMDLIPVYEDEEQGDASSNSSAKVITIDPVVVQNMGVRTAVVKRGTISRKIRTIGEVIVAEDKVSVVNLKFSGWIEKIYVDETGEYVQNGDPLFEIYSPELVSAQGEYLLALKTAGKGSELAETTRNRLLFWDLKEEDIKRIEKERRVSRTVTIRSPVSGYVLRKNAVLGAHIMAGTDIYEIGDLDKIWVNAEVYEFDAPWVKENQKATMELSFEQGNIFNGKVSYVYPTLNKHTRTLTVRLEFPNPDLRLRPGMFATVWIEVEPREGVIKIPLEAVIHSGERQLVFVSPKLGRYEAREVITGIIGGDRSIEIIKGVLPGEEVVISGQFLLDSESQLQEAIEKLVSARLQANKKSKEPAGSNGVKRNSDSQIDKPMASEQTGGGETYWTCGMHPHVIQDGPGKCPICGMDLVERKR